MPAGSVAALPLYPLASWRQPAHSSRLDVACGWREPAPSPGLWSRISAAAGACPAPTHWQFPVLLSVSWSLRMCFLGVPWPPIHPISENCSVSVPEKTQACRVTSLAMLRSHGRSRSLRLERPPSRGAVMPSSRALSSARRACCPGVTLQAQERDRPTPSRPFSNITEDRGPVAL